MASKKTNLKIYFCKGMIGGKPCPNKIEGFSSRKDPKAEKKHDRPQCYMCGRRVGDE